MIIPSNDPHTLWHKIICFWFFFFFNLCDLQFFKILTQYGVIASIWTLELRSTKFEPQLYDLFHWLISNNLKISKSLFPNAFWDNIKIKLTKVCKRIMAVTVDWLDNSILFQILFWSLCTFKWVVNGSLMERVSLLIKLQGFWSYLFLPVWEDNLMPGGIAAILEPRV